MLKEVVFMKHLRTLICLAVVFSPSITQAQVTRSTDTLPPAQSKYVSPAQFHQAYANGIILTNPSHNRFLQKKPVHPPNKIGKSITEKFMSTVTADVTINGTTVTISAPAKVKVNVTFTSQTGNVRVFTTQMLELTVKGGSLPPGAELSLIPGQPT